MDKGVIILIAVVFLAIEPPSSRAQDTWKEYRFPDKNMAFSMPSRPVESSQSVNTAPGTITLYSYALQFNQDSKSLAVWVNSFPAQVLQIPPEQFLAGERDGILKGGKGTLISQSKLTLNGHPGIAFEFIQTNSSVNVRFSGTNFSLVAYHASYRVYLAGTSMYQLESVAIGGAALLPETERFMNSFRILNP